MRKKWYILSALCVVGGIGAFFELLQGKESANFGTFFFSLALALLFFWMGWRKRERSASEKNVAQSKSQKKAGQGVVVISSSAMADSLDEKEAQLFKSTFYLHMGQLGGFPASDVDRIYFMLSGNSKSIGDTAVSYTPEAVLESEFADREWTWSEMDEWEAVFSKEGRFPIAWKNWWNAPNMGDMDVPRLCNLLTVDKMREIATSLSLAPSSKAKKGDLIKLLEDNASVADIAASMPEWEELARERKREKSKARGRALLDIIRHRAGSRNLAQKFSETGRKVKLVLDSPADEPYIQRALEKNPSAVPPFFPGDSSRYSL